MAKKQFLYSASVPARECWIDRERGQHYKIKTEMLPRLYTYKGGLKSLYNFYRFYWHQNHDFPMELAIVRACLRGDDRTIENMFKPALILLKLN